MASSSSIEGVIVRGGTSKGLFIDESKFPYARGSFERDIVIQKLFGVPDPTGMQLNGVGGGISSTSKVVFLNRSKRQSFGIDYDFGRSFFCYDERLIFTLNTNIDSLLGQVGMTDGKVDWTGSCGNLASALLVASKALGLVKEEVRECRVWQVNVGEEIRVREREDMIEIPGVPGKASAIEVELMGDPSTSVLPSDNAVDEVKGETCTIIKGSNSTIFFPFDVLTKNVNSNTTDKEYHSWIESIRGEVAERMNVKLNDGLRVSFVKSPEIYQTSSNATIQASEYDIYAKMTAMPNSRRFHHAFTGTGSVNLGIAANIPGTIVHSLMSSNQIHSKKEIRIGHPGGVMKVHAKVSNTGGIWRGSVCLERTARLIMKGLFYI